MEHIVTIAININDDDIKDKIEESVRREATKQVADKLSSHIINACGGMHRTAEEVIETVVKRYEDRIIEEAVEQVTVGIKRSKKYKETLVTVAERILEDK